MGEKYIEPSGKVLIENKTTGDSCLLTFKSRGGFFTSSDNISAIEGEIKDNKGVAKYRIYGKFTDRIEAEDLET